MSVRICTCHPFACTGPQRHETHAAISSIASLKSISIEFPDGRESVPSKISSQKLATPRRTHLLRDSHVCRTHLGGPAHVHVGSQSRPGTLPAQSIELLRLRGLVESCSTFPGIQVLRDSHELLLPSRMCIDQKGLH